MHQRCIVFFLNFYEDLPTKCQKSPISLRKKKITSTSQTENNNLEYETIRLSKILLIFTQNLIHLIYKPIPFHLCKLSADYLLKRGLAIIVFYLILKRVLIGTILGTLIVKPNIQLQQKEQYYSNTTENVA